MGALIYSNKKIDDSKVEVRFMVDRDEFIAFILSKANLKLKDVDVIEQFIGRIHVTLKDGNEIVIEDITIHLKP